MDRQTQIIMASGLALSALIGYAIYTDLSRFFPDKKKGCDKSKCKNKDEECC